jgi:hypothetical protein
MTHDEQSRRRSARIAFALLAASVALLGVPVAASSEQFVQQGEKLTGAGEMSFNFGLFGYGVALSADANTALIGAQGDNHFQGAAWVFARSGSTWTQQGEKLTGAGEVGEGRFAVSVALSADGNTALFGGEGDNEDVGAAWVFTRSGSTWTQQGEKLVGGGEAGKAEVGRSVALSSDGNTALVGGTIDNGQQGAAWVFTRSGSTWTQQGPKLTPSDASGNPLFGASVALSSDGNTALIGGGADNGFRGAAWVFIRSGSTWSQQGPKLTGSGEVGTAEFGGTYSDGMVALSGDGNTALVGAGDDNTFAGAAWVFTRSGTTWSQQGEKLTSGGAEGCCTKFGISVALSEDGNTALIGGEGAHGSAGAAWVFTRSGTTWSHQGSEITACGEVENAELGKSVALSSLGTTALVGGSGDNRDAGAAWLFAPGAAGPPPTVEAVSPRKGSTGRETTVTITGTNLCGATAVEFGGHAAYNFVAGSPTSITATAPSEPLGTVDVTVTTPGGTSVAGEADRFTYVVPPPLPSVVKVRPRRGPSAGGTTVKINGTNFGEASAVEFGFTSAASFKVISPTSIIAVSPPGHAGVVDVRVRTPEDVSAPVRKDHFRYVG